MLSARTRTLLPAGGLTLFLTLVHLTNDAFTSTLAALLPSLQVKFGLAETILATFVATLSLSSSMMQPLFGVLADRLGQRLIGALGIILSSSLLSLMGVAPAAWILFGLLLLGGLGSAAFHPPATTMVRSVERKTKGLGVAIFSAGGSIGVALGPIIVLYLVAHYGLSSTPWMMIPGVGLGVLFYFIIPPQPRTTQPKPPKLFDLSLIMGPVGMLVLVGILRSIPFITFINATPLWLVQTQGVAPDSPLIGWVLAVFSVGVAIGGIIAGALTSRFSVDRILVITMALAFPLLATTLITNPNGLVFFILVLLAGASLGPGLPLLIVTAQDLAPQAKATASGMLGGLTAGTAGLLYIAVGHLQNLLGIGPATFISYLFLIPSTLLTHWVLHKQKPR